MVCGWPLRRVKIFKMFNLLVLVIVTLLIADIYGRTISCNNHLIRLFSQRNTSSPRKSKILHQAIEATQAFYEKRKVGFNNHIPSIIHQIWYDSEKPVPPQVASSIESFRHWNPYATHLLWEKEDLDELIEQLYPSLSHLFSRLPRVILKVDLLRFLLLQQFGGVYSDIDTLCLKPAYDWSNEYRNVSLIVGYEASLRDDIVWQSHPTLPKPLARDVQLASWTVASAPLHPLIAKLLQGCVEKVKNMTEHDLFEYDVLDFAGPGAWTDVILEYIRYYGYTEDHIYHAQKPLCVGDVYILPAPGFRWENNGDPHLACIRHTFLGSWKKTLSRQSFK